MENIAQRWKVCPFRVVRAVSSREDAAKWPVQLSSLCGLHFEICTVAECLV